MAKLVTINSDIHRNLAVNPQKAELHGAELNLIPVVMGEFVNAAVQFPIVITKNGDTGEFVCAAMLGFEAHENLFWQNGQWQGIYLPLQIQRQPFFIANTQEVADDKTSSNLEMCIDMDSPAIIDSSVEHEQKQCLFIEDGQESDYLKHAKLLLGQLLQGEQDNQRLLAALKQYDLIQPLSLEVTFANDKSTRLNGLYTINQDALAKLSESQIVQLHRDGLLQAIYTMVTSLGQIYALIARKNSQFF